MNKARRKEISLICKRLLSFESNINKSKSTEDIKDILNNIYQDINFIFWDENDYMENIPENMQNGYRYEKAEKACENLEEAMDSIKEAEECSNADSMIKCIKEAIDYLSDASM